MSAAKWRPFCPGRDELKDVGRCIFSVYYKDVTHSPSVFTVYAHGHGPLLLDLYINLPTLLLGKDILIQFDKLSIHQIPHQTRYRMVLDMK